MLNAADQKLLDAARNHNLEEIKSAVRDGANINAIDAQGNTALHLVHTNANPTGIEEVYGFLVTHGIDVHAANKSGKKAIHLVASMKNSAFIEALLNAKPELLEEKSQSGKTPIMVACYLKCTNAMQALIQRNPDMDALDDKDRSGKFYYYYQLKSTCNEATVDSIIQRIAELDAQMRGITEVEVGQVIADLIAVYGEHVNSATAKEYCPSNFMNFLKGVSTAYSSYTPHTGEGAAAAARYETAYHAKQRVLQADPMATGIEQEFTSWKATGGSFATTSAPKPSEADVEKANAARLALYKGLLAMGGKNYADMMCPDGAALLEEKQKASTTLSHTGGGAAAAAQPSSVSYKDEGRDLMDEAIDAASAGVGEVRLGTETRNTGR